jgi:hypothetical protein
MASPFDLPESRSSKSTARRNNSCASEGVRPIAVAPSFPNVGIAIADGNGRLIFANQAARDCHPVDALVEMIVTKALLTGTDVRVDRYEYRAGANARRWATITASPVADRHRPARAVIITIADVTESIQATEWRPIIESLARL